jgi:hypothetical protein
MPDESILLKHDTASFNEGFSTLRKNGFSFENSETADSDAALRPDQRIPQPRHWDYLKTCIS